MKFRGFVGTAAYQGQIKPLLPLIMLGQHLHIGNKTSFGMGKYEIQGKAIFDSTTKEFFG